MGRPPLSEADEYSNRSKSAATYAWPTCSGGNGVCLIGTRPPVRSAQLGTAAAIRGVRSQIEDEMLALPSLTPADMAAKMIAFHGHDGAATCLDFDGEYWAEARALVA